MPIPSTMHFVDHGTGGGPEVLTPSTCATPTPKVGEVLVKLAYAGVNRPD
jgi:NADPH:quinone reductase-like Zn-dependent oxidoreductase